MNRVGMAVFRQPGEIVIESKVGSAGPEMGGRAQEPPKQSG
jgi:hypothetical protein